MNDDILIFMSDLSEELQSEIIERLQEINPKYVSVLQSNLIPLTSININEFENSDPFIAEIIDMNETEEEEKNNPKFIICRTYCLEENYNHPDFCLCLNLGEEKLSNIIGWFASKVINGEKVDDEGEFVINNEKYEYRLIDSEDGEMVFIILGDEKNGLFPEDDECDPIYKNQIKYFEMINTYYSINDILEGDYV